MSTSSLRLVGCARVAISREAQGIFFFLVGFGEFRILDFDSKMGRYEFSGAFDPELRSVLELATDSELYELERILFGPRYFQLYMSYLF